MVALCMWIANPSPHSVEYASRGEFVGSEDLARKRGLITIIWWISKVLLEVQVDVGCETTLSSRIATEL